MRLQDKVAIVTGGGRGIGRGIAKVFAREGAKVLLAARTRAELERVVEEISGQGGEAHSVVADMGRTEDVGRMVEACITRYDKLDILVNNAGIGWWGYAIDDPDVPESYDTLMATNLRGPWMAAHFAVPHMKESGGGSIINIASVHAWATFPSGSAYAASKGGMVAGTRGLAVELAKYLIRVNTISPGAIPVQDQRQWVTEQYGPEAAAEFVERYGDVLDARFKGQQPLPLTGTPEDIAYCAVYLASEESRFVTGANITVDGGMTAELGQGLHMTAELRDMQQEMQAWLRAQEKARSAERS